LGLIKVRYSKSKQFAMF